jgi:hypothetical protein
MSNLPKTFKEHGKIRFTITNNNLHHGIYFIDLSVVRPTFGHLFNWHNCQQFLIKSRDPRDHLVEYANLLSVFEFTVEHDGN